MNYLQMFAKGGKTKGTDIIKGIQKILGVDDNQMAELWQVGINKYGSEEGIAQALNEATKGLTPQSSPDEVKAAVATVFSTGSEMFKCGGKLQKLAKRFSKGSSIDCGCNGTKLKQNGGLLNNRFYNLPDRVYNEKGVFSGYINGPEDIAYIQSRKEPRDWTVQSPTPQARLNNTTNQSRMLWNPEKLPEPYYTAYVITENPEGKGTVAHIPMNQDGGEVTEAANGVRLTRRQARDLSKQNKGYNDSQYTTAYYNALDALRRNSDLRGKDLRNQARIMASGINVGDNTQTITDTSVPQIAIAVAPAGQLNEVKTRDQALNDLVSSVIRGDYGNGAQRKESLGTYYDETQAEVAKRVKNTQKKSATVTNSIASQRIPVIASSIERSTTYNEGPVFGGQSRKVQVLPSNEQVVISESVPAQTRVSPSNASNERNRRMGRVEAYQRMTGADEALAEWGQQPYQNVDRNSEEYRQGQRDARREAAITTGAGIASAVAIPAAINAAATYIPQGIQYARLANDLNRTRRAAQAARGTGQMLMRNAGSTATRYTPNQIFRMLETSRLTPLPGSLQKGGIVKGQTGIVVPEQPASTGEIRVAKYEGPVKQWINNVVDNNSALRGVKQSFYNFSQSAPGKVLEFLMPDVDNLAMAAVPGVKFIPEQAVGRFGDSIAKKSSKYIKISPERGAAVVKYRTANDPAYKKALESMEQSLKQRYNPDLMYEYQKLKTFGATNADELVQFEKMMNDGYKAEDIATSLKPRKTGINTEWMYGSGYAPNDFGQYNVEAAKKINGLRKNLYDGWYNNTTNLPK